MLALLTLKRRWRAAMNNYMMYMGTDSIYTHTVAYARDETCTVCGSGTPLPVSLSMTLQQVRPTGPRPGQFLWNLIRMIMVRVAKLAVAPPGRPRTTSYYESWRSRQLLSKPGKPGLGCHDSPRLA